MEQEKPKIMTEEQVRMSDMTLMFIKLNEIDAKINELLQRRDTQAQLYQPQQMYPQQAPQYQRPVEKKMYPAVCSQCGQNCFIPFKARPETAIKCTECYKASHGY